MYIFYYIYIYKQVCVIFFTIVGIGDVVPDFMSPKKKIKVSRASGDDINKDGE